MKNIVHQVAAMCDELGIVFIVIDSVMLARSGDAFGPEETIHLFGALSEIGRPALLADHKSREAISKGRKGAYGSVAGQNSARLLWEGREGPGSGVDGRKVIVLENTKANNAPKHPPVALALTWTKEPTHSFLVERLSADGMIDRADNSDARHWEILHQTLDVSPPMTVAELAARHPDIGPDNIRRSLNRHPDQFTNLKAGERSPGLWTTPTAQPLTLDLDEEANLWDELSVVDIPARDELPPPF